MKSAYQTSGKVFEQVSKLYKPGLLEQLREIKDGEIVEVKGVHDHIEVLLDTLKVPYTQINPGEMAAHNGGRVMLVNCMEYHSVPKKTTDAVREFVGGGGRLVTTDWALSLVAKAFPGKLQHIKNTSDEVVEIEAHTDIARKFMGMNYAQCHPQWWLEGSSHVYSVSDGVIPIITSDEMQEKYGQPYVTVGFTEGSGEVFHFISHLELQRTRQKTKAQSGSLDDFLKKMKVSKTADMDEAKVAELEAAYSTLNALAYLCLPAPLLSAGDMKSVFTGKTKQGVGTVSQKLV